MNILRNLISIHNLKCKTLLKSGVITIANQSGFSSKLVSEGTIANPPNQKTDKEPDKGDEAGEKKSEIKKAAKKHEVFTSVEGLTEFFDEQVNWNKREVKVGRSWKIEELRIKSNSDLHKLWYVLLKEKNMLLTMKHEYDETWRSMPNPERIDKVDESMENIETVVRERNKAYFMLETGVNGERPGKLTENAFGLRSYHKMSEHLIPEFMNVKWKIKHKTRCSPKEIQEFLMSYREQLWLKRKRKMALDRNHVMGLIKRFPDIDLNLLKSQYPHVNVDKVKSNIKSQGHYLPKY